MKSLSALLGALALMVGCASLPPRQTLHLGDTAIAWSLAGQQGPVVVLQSGLGDGMDPWADVIKGLAPHARVFAYDRPGYGGSSRVPPGGRSACTIATELRAALRAAGLAPPYLLVGHSIGGQYQYAFARQYPEEVAGLLLLDPTHPDHWHQMQARSAGMASIVAGLRKISFTPVMREEFDDQGRCLEQARTLPAGRFASKLLVRTQFALTESDDFRAMTRDLERDWLTLLPGATAQPVPGATHYIQRDQPAVVVREALALLRGSR